jgi:phage portal protein BeeE
MTNVFEYLNIDHIGNAGTLKARRSQQTKPTDPGGDVIERQAIIDGDGVFKSYIPKFLYKPPFGYPRSENIPMIKVFAKNPYVYSVIRMIQEEAANASWEIGMEQQDEEMSDELHEIKKQIIDVLRNPNGNKEGWSHIIKVITRDILESDSGVWVKVFNRLEEMVQIFARDGGSFLKNPDIHGYMGNRQDIIFPDTELKTMVQGDPNAIKYYDLKYKNQAAYFQYGWVTASMPIPFGKREVVYFMQNPRGDDIYGVSPVAILGDIILTLVYGSQYNLDFYMNSNMPEGIISLLDAKQKQIKAFRERFDAQFIKEDTSTGFKRKTGYKVPIVNTKTEFIPFQLSAREMEIIAQQEWFTKIVWMCFGIGADDMGFTEDSNKAVSDSQSKKYAKKAVRPILNLIAERINMEIIPEFGTNELAFRFDDYDLDEDIKKHSLYAQQINMGIKTPEMVAIEEKIDIGELDASMQKNDEREVEKNKQMNEGGFNGFEKKGEKSGVKALLGGDLEKELTKQVKANAKKILKALETVEKGALQNVQ